MKNLFHLSGKFVFTILLFFLINPTGNILLAQEYSEQAAGDLVWSDEFEGSGPIDGTKWERQEYNRKNNNAGPDGWWSKEDSYLDGTGNLVIRVREIPDKNNDGDSCDYSCGALRTKGKFSKLYGKYEIRCKLPTQSGWWVAFWMMQGNVGGIGNGGVDGMEVDIMEGFGWTNLINNAFHWDGYGDFHKSTGRQFRPAGIREGFHTFAMEWYPEMYIFFIDGKETFRSIGGGVCKYPGYIKVTGEISTEAWATTQYWSSTINNAVYPDSFLVDYVRVYDVGKYVFPAGISSVSGINPVKLYPNPGQNQINLSWEPVVYPNNPEIAIYNTTGRLIKSFGPVENNSTLPIHDLSKGIYIISISGDGNTGYLRFVKI